MTRYEYANLWSYKVHRYINANRADYTSAWAYVLQTENDSVLLAGTWQIAALNEVGDDGWLEYRRDSTGGTRVRNLNRAHLAELEKRLGWTPEQITYDTVHVLRRQLDD